MDKEKGMLRMRKILIGMRLTEIKGTSMSNNFIQTMPFTFKNDRSLSRFESHNSFEHYSRLLVLLNREEEEVCVEL